MTATRVQRALEAHLRGETEFFTAEFRLRHKEGHWVWIEDRGRVSERNECGEPVLVSGAHRDITEQKKREQALADSEQHLRMTLNSIDEGLIATDPNGQIIRMNQAAEALTGWSSEESVGEQIDHVFSVTSPPAQPESQISSHSDEVSTDSLQDSVLLESRDGRQTRIVFSLNQFADTSSDTSGLVLTFRDVTDEFRMQQELRRSEAVLERTSRVAKIGGWELELPDNDLWLSDEAKRIFDIPLDESVPYGEIMDLIVRDEDRARLERAMQVAIDDGTSYAVEFLIHLPDDREMNLLATGMPVVENGECVRLHGAVQDITERKRSEEELQRMQRLESLGPPRRRHRPRLQQHPRWFFRERFIRQRSAPE